MSALRVVLLGILGHGKTYLFNKITNATEPVTYGGNSVTKQIVIGQAAHGEFEVVDTPGFDAQEDKLLHAAGVIAALAQGEVNRILIVIKCERTDIMIKNIKKIIEPISRYKDLITFIVTYWDEQQRSIQQHYKSQESQSKQELEAKQQIEAAIKKNYNISSVIFSSSQDDPIIILNLLVEQIYNILFISQNKQLILFYHLNLRKFIFPNLKFFVNLTYQAQVRNLNFNQLIPFQKLRKILEMTQNYFQILQKL